MPIYAITGANRGLGLEFTRQLSADSSNTILAATRSMSSDLSDLKALNKHSNIHILECDTGSISSIESFIDSVAQTLGGKKIDYLLNNAGVNSVPEQRSMTINPDDLNREVQINVVGPAKTTEFAVKKGILSDNVVVMNMTSGLGSMAVNLSITPRKCCTYSISKAALNMLTVHQAGDLKEKLSGAIVICMDPGWVKTRMGGEGAVLEPEESIGGMLKCIHGLGKDDNGKFYTYTGKEVPW
ncbi:hypothetical protein H2203_006252 [Taxawa tesnikishii (nom. ined.)]|nr:hypothetical protein H2203_006252 [Dothideales sp. JES 119]